MQTGGEMKEIFGRRLKNARKMRGLSMDELSKNMNNLISKQAISKYENGKMLPDSSVLIAFSHSLAQPIDYFFRPFTFQIDSIEFRKKSRLSIKKIESVKEQIIDLLERYIEIEEICAIDTSFSHASFFKIASSEDVFISAKKLKNEWELGEDGINNVIEMLEERGVKVLEIDADASFDGLSSMVNNKHSVIVVNKNCSSERKRFTILHELGHLVLNFDKEINSKNQESLCNLFASEMLISSIVFKQIIGTARHDISYQELRVIQEQFGISIDALMYKAKDLGIISENRYISYCKKKNTVPSLKQKIEESIYPTESSNRFSRLVYRALASDLISSSKAASLLGISLNQVHEDVALV